MKKIAAFILILAILCSLLTACGEQKSSDASPPQDTSSVEAAAPLESGEWDELTHRLLADWYGYLIRCEYFYGDLRWALSYLTPFFEDHSWDSLQIARAAMAASKRRAEHVKEQPFEKQMTLEDYNKFIRSGADVSAIQVVIDSIPTLVDDTLLTYQNYRDFVNSPTENLFSTYNLSCLEEWARLERQIYDIHLHDTAVETDYLLLSLNSQSEKDRFVTAIEEKCPQINAWRSENPKDKEGLEKLSSELLTELQSLTNDMSSLVGKMRTGLNLEKEASETDTFEQYVDRMAADVANLKDFPIALPYPDWWYEEDNETFFYSWNSPLYGTDEESGPRSFIAPGDTVNVPPDEFNVDWVGVSLEDYLAYVDLLEKSYHIPAQYTVEKEGRYITSYELPSFSSALVWEENNVALYVLDGAVCFAPPWYIYYSQHSDS